MQFAVKLPVTQQLPQATLGDGTQSVTDEPHPFEPLTPSPLSPDDLTRRYTITSSITLKAT